MNELDYAEQKEIEILNERKLQYKMSWQDHLQQLNTMALQLESDDIEKFLVHSKAIQKLIVKAGDNLK
jgi:hypothetical protein